MGLLDFTNTPEGMQGLALLAAAGPSMQPMNFASRLAMAGDTYRAMQDNALKNKVTQAQLEDFTQQAELRRQQTAQLQRRNDLINAWLGGGLGGGTGGAGQPAIAPSPGGLLGSGTFGIPTGGQSAVTPSTPFNGVPRDAITADLAFNDGKGLGDMIFKRGVPDMQVSNGYAFDKNRTQPGFLPQLNVSQNGQASVVTIGPDGMPQMSAPAGSVETYRQFRNADEEAKAGSDLVQVYNPQTKRMEFRSRSSVLGTQPTAPVSPPAAPASLPPAQPGVNGNFTGDPRAVMNDIMGIRDPQERANALAAYVEQAKRTPNFAQGAEFQGSQGSAAAGPSAAEATQAAAQKEYGTQVAKDIAEQRKAIMQADFSAQTNIAKYQRLGTLLQNVDGGKLTPLGTDIASAANSIGLKIDKNLPNKQAAAAMANEIALQLRNPQGGAGMPGALSDRDREFLVSMTPGITQSAEGRKQIIDSYIALQQRNRQVAQFARNYEKKYGQLDNGFFDQLSAWSSQNPLFGGK